MGKKKTKNTNSNTKKDAPVSASKHTKKPGLTPTQLHNARKRRAKQKKQQHSSNTTTNAVNDPSAQYLHNPNAAPLVQAAKRFFADRLDSFPIYQNGPKTGWRTVSKLPVRKQENGKVVVGMFQPNSHQVAKSQATYPAHHPSINKAMATIAAACQEMGIAVFDEHSGSGYLRYVAMNIERSTGKVQLTLIWKDEPYSDLNWEIKSKKKKKTDREMAQAQLERLIGHLLNINNEDPKLLHSLWVHYNDAWKHSNAIFDIHDTSGKTWQHIYGPKMITERLKDGPTLHFGPNVFRQANIDAFEYIIAAIQKRIQQEKTKPLNCLELYGGVGTIGLQLLERVTSLTCSDENPHNKPCFDASRELLEPERRQRVKYVPLNASDMVRENHLEGKQVVVVDPPRKGLEDVVLEHFVDKQQVESLQLLIYVSCGFDAFQRDCQRLTDSGHWKLEHAEGHILFPGANAIETLAFFTRK